MEDSTTKVLGLEDEFKGNAGGENYQTILTDAREKKVME